VVAGTDKQNPIIHPTNVAFAPDGRIFITEKRGTIRIIDAKGNLQAAPWVNLIEEVGDSDDRGLLGIGIDPNFPANQFQIENTHTQLCVFIICSGPYLRST
jgi:glucose/arabinose dehydrogenase